MSPNDADGMANSVDPDQTAPRSGSALFAQAYLSENLGSLRYSNSRQQSSRHVDFADLLIELKFIHILTRFGTLQERNMNNCINRFCTFIQENLLDRLGLGPQD